MNVVSRFLHQPQRVWLRRATFQIHLWTGLALGLYVVVLSITGSLLVYRAELDRFLATPRATLNERDADDGRSVALGGGEGLSGLDVSEVTRDAIAPVPAGPDGRGRQSRWCQGGGAPLVHGVLRIHGDDQPRASRW